MSCKEKRGGATKNNKRVRHKRGSTTPFTTYGEEKPMAMIISAKWKINERSALFTERVRSKVNE